MISSPKKICVVGEWLHGVPDEGIHNLAQNLLDQWRKDHPVWTIRIGTDLLVNRLFLSLQLRKMLRNIRPDLVFYISPSSMKIAALFRAKMLKLYCSQAQVLIIALQPIVYNDLERRLLSPLVPDGIFVQSPRGKEQLQGLRCPVYFLPSGVDLNRFMPVDADQKIALRQRYGVNEKAFVVLHVGHIQQSRNIELISIVPQLRDVQVILVGSTSTPQDEALVRQLTHLDVRVVREFMPHIEELYQLADVYLFPVVSEHAAIGVPLSVLEAMACNLPVITTRFGGLPQMFPEGRGLFYFNDEAELPKLMKSARSLSQYGTRQMVETYAWSRVAHKALEMTLTEDS